MKGALEQTIAVGRNNSSTRLSGMFEKYVAQVLAQAFPQVFVQVLEHFFVTSARAIARLSI